MTQIIAIWLWLAVRLRGVGEWIPRLTMRLVMGWEFWESGVEKLHGENWFANVQQSFPFPFNVVPTGFSWQIATWFELIAAVMLWIGLGTRFFAFGLLFLTFVATAAVHWPDMWMMASDLLKGYAVTNHGDGNFKLPLLFVVMLIPLIFNGPGKLSLDHLVARALHTDVTQKPLADTYAWALACVVFGLPFLMLIPKFGAGLLVLGVALAGYARWQQAK